MKKLLTSFLSLLILGISGFTYGERVETEIVKFSNGFKVGNVDTNVYTNMPSGGSSTNIINTNRLVAITTSDNIGFENSTAPVAGQSSSVWMGQYALASAAGVGNSMFGWAAGYQGGGNTSVGIGYQALYQCTGNDNVGVGSAALSGAGGNQNVAIGAGAGNGASATKLIAVGANSAQSIGGSLNVAVGYEAMKLSTGNGNTAINSAMQASPSTNSIAIGDGAGNNSPGLENVSVGYVSGNSSIGSYNSSVGPGSRWNSVGSYNNAFGLHALADCYGSYNVAFGSESLRYGTGNYNVAIGEFAGEHTGGTSNTYIGAYSGNSATYTVYTNASTLGANVKPKGSSTVAIGLSNQTVYIDGSLVVSNTSQLGTVTAGTWQGSPIQGQYIAFSRTNLNKTYVFDALAVSNATAVLPYMGANISWGKLYASATNTFSKNMQLTFYANNDYKSTNAYWRANLSLVTVAITNSTLIGTNAVHLADATGFSTNDMVYFCDSNEFARVLSISGNVLTLEDNLLYPHGTTSSVSRVAEYGGFSMIDYSGTSNLWHRISATNVFTNTLQMDLSIRR